MKDKKISCEKMRYCVPKLFNRFWQVHAKFIFACALCAVTAIVLALSYSVIRTERSLEPRRVCVFFCETAIQAEYKSGLEKFEPFTDVYFVAYDEDFKPQDENTDKKYDFSRISALTSFENPPQDVLLIVLLPTLSIDEVYKYADFGFEDGAALSLKDVENVLSGVIA